MIDFFSIDLAFGELLESASLKKQTSTNPHPLPNPAKSNQGTSTPQTCAPLDGVPIQATCREGAVHQPTARPPVAPQKGRAMTASGKMISGVRTFAADVTEGFLEITHNSFALLGLAVAFVVIALTARPDLRQAGEEQLMNWLQARQVELLGMPIEPGASERATAGNPKDLPKEQAAVAFWLSKKYRVAPAPFSVMVY